MPKYSVTIAYDVSIYHNIGFDAANDDAAMEVARAVKLIDLQGPGDVSDHTDNERIVVLINDDNDDTLIEAEELPFA